MFDRFISELNPTGVVTELYRKALDDFVNNNQQGSPDSNDYLRWIASKVQGTYEKPDPTSANGVTASLGLAAAGAVTGSAEVKAAKETGTVYKDFNQARNAALKWLEEKGFKAEQATLGKFGENAGKPIGMRTSDGKVGFRVEYDQRNGAHINVWAEKEKGPHFNFEGNESVVNRIVKQFQN
jgi:hypothetical protein